jgi:leader peptidase (prepilin peptidase)/N-methyltransferase
VGGTLLTTAALLGGQPERLLPAAIGAVASFLFYFLLAMYPQGMGFGDVKLAGVLGLFLGFLGWPQLVVGVASAFLLGGVIGIVLLLAHRTRGRKIPFGPWMVLGAWIGIFAGEPIAAAYLGLVGIS